MKKLLLLLSMFVLVQANGQTDTSKLTVREVYQDAKSGFREVVGGLKEVAAKLEGPAKRVYGIYVYQYKVKAFIHLSATIFFFIVAFTILYINWRKANFSESDWNRYTTLSLAGIIVSFGVLILCITFFASALGYLLNPEYYAIQDIVKAFK